MRAVWWGLVLVGCGSASKRVEIVHETPAAPGEPSDEPGGEPQGRLEGARVAVREGETLGELIIDGKPHPVSFQGRTLRVGPHTIEVAGEPAQVLLLDDPPAVVVHHDVGEDEGAVGVFAVRKGELAPLYHHSSMSTYVVRVPGGFESRSGQCGETFVTRVLLAGDAPQVQEEHLGQRDPDCVGAACPFVDVWVAGRWQTQGEILRDLVGPEAEGPQTLALPAQAIAGGRVRVRLAERKPEVTQLDAVWLRVGEQEFAPVGCVARALCEDGDGGAQIGPGEHLELVFEVGDARGEPVLWADGYYVPLGR